MGFAYFAWIPARCGRAPRNHVLKHSQVCAPREGGRLPPHVAVWLKTWDIKAGCSAGGRAVLSFLSQRLKVDVDNQIRSGHHVPFDLLRVFSASCQASVFLLVCFFVLLYCRDETVSLWVEELCCQTKFGLLLLTFTQLDYQSERLAQLPLGTYFF